MPELVSGHDLGISGIVCKSETDVGRVGIPTGNSDSHWFILHNEVAGIEDV